MTWSAPAINGTGSRHSTTFLCTDSLQPLRDTTAIPPLPTRAPANQRRTDTNNKVVSKEDSASAHKERQKLLRR